MKKILSVLLAMSMIFTLTACGSKEAETSPGESDTTTAQDEKLDYPESGELRIMVPFKTGGALDGQVRTTAKYLADVLGVNVVVENTAGAGGQLGTTEYLSEEANTSTILLTDGWLMTVTPLVSQVQYSVDEYVPIIDHNITNFCLFANPKKTGIETFEDLQEYGKSSRVVFGSGGAGTSLYILQKSLLDQMDIASDTITQNNTSEGLANLMAGTVDVSVSSFKDAADYVKNGDIVPILWFGDDTYTDDDAFSAGVPCAKDKGIDITYTGFYYYSIRKGTDAAIVEKLHDAINEVYANPDFIAESEQIGFQPTGITSDEITAYLDEFTTMAKTTFTLD